MIDNVKLKPFEKYGGWLAVGLTVAIPAVLLWVFAAVLIELAKNTVILIALLGIGAFLAMTVLNPATWEAVYLWWTVKLKAVRKAVIKENPIAVLDVVITRLRRKLEEIEENISRAVGAAKTQAAQLGKALKQVEQELSLARVAKQSGKELEARQHAVAAGRWEDTAKSMGPMQDTLLSMKTAFERARDLCAATLQDTESKRDTLAFSLETMKTAQQTVKGFKKFFTTNKDLDLLNEAAGEAESQAYEAEAEIEEFIRVTNPLLDTQDLKKQAEALKAMDRFESYLSGDKTQKQLAGQNVVEGIVVTENMKSRVLKS